MIQQILTRPNPQGMAALGGGLGTGGVAMGGGIAGVASKHDAEGIKIYKEKTNYKEWEFIYDPAKDQKTGQGGTVGGPIPGLGNMGTGSSTGSSGFGGGQQQPSTGFGGQQQGGFGQQRR
jgi:hypothetical protein